MTFNEARPYCANVGSGTDEEKYDYDHTVEAKEGTLY
jgi:hypothetical protein